MAFDTGNYIIIGGSGSNKSNDVWIHERENNNGKPGKVLTMADAKGDVKEIAKTYIDKGFDPNKIIINGQPAKDVFNHETKNNDSDKLKIYKIGKPQYYNPYDPASPNYNPVTDPTNPACNLNLLHPVNSMI